MSQAWLDWDDLEKLLAARKAVFFGTSDIAEKTMNRISKPPILFIDNNPNKENTLFHNVKVVKPSSILDLDEDFFILISILSEHDGLKNQLDKMGYKEGVDYFFSPLLKKHRHVADMRLNNQTILFSSAESPKSNSGGGIYSYNFKTKDLQKLHHGRFYQLLEVEDRIYAVEHYEGIKVFDENLSLVKEFDILPLSAPHGMTANIDEGILYIANSGLDSITVMDIHNGNILDEIYISDNRAGTNTDKHHIVDLLYLKGYLYISMFSFSGLWRNDCFDGGIAKLDLKEKKIIDYPMQNMLMPHSVSLIKNDIMCIDSMRGDVYKANTILFSTNGFTRGIANDSKYYYIGQSEHRYFDKISNRKTNIQLNCGLHVFDETTNTSIFYPIDNTSTIYSILIKKF